MAGMKISLITLHRVKNYGSALQSFATERLLRDCGHEVEFVDYWRPDLTDSIDDYFRRSRWAKYPWMKGLFVIAKGAWVRRNQVVFNEFVQQNLSLSSRSYSSSDELVSDPPVADAYCVGSDQVWNGEYNSGGSDPFFLTFAPVGAKRVAFSSSLGKPRATDDVARLITAELPKFSAVAVREASGVDVLRELGVRSENTLDPTLAVDTRVWSEFASVPANPKRRLVVYRLNKSAQFDEAVRQAEAEIGVRATMIDIRSSRRQTTFRAVQPSLHEWVSLFKNAEHVVTDSFHGTAFSLIFNVPFTVVLPGTYAERLRSVLALVGLSDRVMSADVVFAPAPIDWERVNENLNAGRARSRDFLIRALTPAVLKSEGSSVLDR